jgi:cytochrome c oxidase assembly protein subunit 15
MTLDGLAGYAGLIARRPTQSDALARGVEQPRQKSQSALYHCSFLTGPAVGMASIFHAFPQLRIAAPRLSRRLFGCRPCLNAPVRSSFAASRCTPRQPSVLQSVRWKSTQPLRSSAAIGGANVHGAVLAEAATKTEGRSRSFPKTSSKSVAYWLLGSAASVFGIVIFGGLTRLTESG